MAKRYAKKMKPAAEVIEAACYALCRITHILIFDQRWRHRAKPTNAGEGGTA
jgi:hypothetical protein